MTSTTTVFGLDVESDNGLLLLEGSGSHPTGRSLVVSVDSGDSRPDWPRSGTELISDERQPDGSIIFQIETHPEAGFLIHGPRYGGHLLSSDGKTLRCAPQGTPAESWQRLLIAQVLPFAALLRGLEVFHASAVVRAGKAIAFLGPSTSGKTSLALALSGVGAAFLTDDVLTLESRAQELWAHPGTAVAGVNHRGQTGLGKEVVREAPSGPVVAVNDRESLVLVQGATEPAPLSALFFLDRRSAGPSEPLFEPDPDPRLLLSATFNFVLDSSARLQGLLDVCAAAAQLRVERIVIGPAASPEDVAVAVERRLSIDA